MKQRKTVTFNDWDITLSEATALMGMRRTILRLEIAGSPVDTDDTATKILRGITYPDLVSAVESQTLTTTWPIPFDEFLELPDSFVAEWERVAYELNPHWKPGYEAQTAEEKKASIGN